MRLIALYTIFNEEDYIEDSLRSIIDEVEGIAILLGDKPFRNLEIKPDRTEEIINGLEDIDNKIVLNKYSVNFLDENDSFYLQAGNLGLDFIKTNFPDVTHLLRVDGDEVWNQKDLISLKEIVEENPEYGQFETFCYTYWKTPEFIVHPIESARFPVISRVNSETKFELIKEGCNRYTNEFPSLNVDKSIKFHHFGYAKEDSKILQKIRIGDYHSKVNPDWFEKVWLKQNSDPFMENLHPIYPESYKRIIRQNLKEFPEVMRGRIKGKFRLESYNKTIDLGDRGYIRIN